MVGVSLPFLAFGAMAIDLPRLAQLASGTRIMRTTTFVVRGSLHPASPLRFGTEEISQKRLKAKKPG